MLFLPAPRHRKPSSPLPHTQQVLCSVANLEGWIINFCCVQKEVVYNHIKTLYLPYTILDVGWWYQIAFPKLPSGKIDYAVALPGNELAGKGNVPSALTHLRDIGKYVAKIITDDRTLNKMVLAYNEMWSPLQVYDLLEKLSGEKLERKYVRINPSP